VPFLVKKLDKVKDTSLRVPPAEGGIVVDTQILRNSETGKIKAVKVFVAQKRKIQPGDKMSGRHGNKGVLLHLVVLLAPMACRKCSFLMKRFVCAT